MLKTLKRKLFHWTNHEEWRQEEAGFVHEVTKEYGQGVKIVVSPAGLYRNLETGEYRKHVGQPISTSTVFKDEGDPEKAYLGWRRLGRYRKVGSVPREAWEADPDMDFVEYDEL